MATTSILGATVFTTAAGVKTITATPALGDLIVVIGANSGRTTAQVPAFTDNNGDGHGTYNLIVSSTKNTSADTMWAYVRADTVQRAVSTVFTFTPNAAADTGGGFVIFKTTGLTLGGLAAIRQSSSQSNAAAAATPAPVMTGACLTGNPALSVVFNATNPSGMVVPASWTGDTDQGYITPTAGMRGAFRSSGNTLTTITWGGTSATAFCDVAVELNAAQGNLDVTFPPERKPRLGTLAVMRTAVWMRKWENTIGGSWGRRESGLVVPAC